MGNSAQSSQIDPIDSDTLRTRCADLFKRTQLRSCTQLEEIDQKARFTSDVWTRTDSNTEDGGGGLSRVLRRGGVFEQAGVNFSEVSGILPTDMAGRLNLPPCDTEFFATGISMVIHPNSPMIPTTHANFRLIEAGSKRWFGGGMDLTPYYLFEEDCVHFHTILKDICDRHDHSFYPQYKKKCDEYFYLPHRKESRGIGGVFFDYLGMNEPSQLESFYTFVEDMCDNFMQSYLPIASHRKNLTWNEHQKSFQLLRRGRYVEFNLLYDRGTLFGLKTGGRTESILMSLPPEVRWEYCDEFPLGDEEQKLLSVVRTPQEWVK